MMIKWQRQLKIFSLPLLGLILPLSLGLTFWLLNFNQEQQWRILAQNKIDYQPLLSSSVQLYQALPSGSGTISSSISTADARPVIIRQYLERYHSPLLPYADDFFQAAEKYRLDYRLLVAIAQQESNLGKKSPPGTYNAWGWGIHQNGTLGFSSWEEGIETVAQGLREDYLDKGFIDLTAIAARYAPPSQESWAFGVNQFMEEME
jgi:hypothetical protein